MSKIVFELDLGLSKYSTDPHASPMSGEEAVRYHRREPQFQCFHCGRFARCVRSYQQYNGTWNIWYADVSCSKCGEYTESLT